MLPELFHIPGLGIPIYSYGLLMVVGFLAATQLAKFLARRSGLDGEVFVNAALLALVTGVIGARLSHVLENLPQYTDSSRSAWANFTDAVNLRAGGLTFYGGFLLAFPVLLLYGRWKRVPLRVGMDIVAPCLMLGLGFGRVGCFLNGCCYGAECSWGVRYPYQSNAYVDQWSAGRIEPPDELVQNTARGRRLLTMMEARNQGLADLAHKEHSLPLHPAQFYCSFNAFLLCALLLAFFSLRPAPGRVFALMLILYGLTRFLLEMLRAEPPLYPPFFGPLSVAMVTSLFIVPLGVVLWIVFGRLAQESDRMAPMTERVGSQRRKINT